MKEIINTQWRESAKPNISLGKELKFINYCKVNQEKRNKNSRNKKETIAKILWILRSSKDDIISNYGQ